MGTKPSISIDETRMTDSIGCLANNHRTRAKRERTKKIVSEVVISFSPCLRPNKNITKHIIAAASVTNAPGPA